ncbi:hypothetical protein [Deinococcus peraridilitoris]|uniref:hypothetical protein n=1 Tax=Deinococcus peraridilitoris TaxID=432329 RepID=UPI0012F9C094|nr:hypothetical protein [Deinococcus peraridilitoris]
MSFMQLILIGASEAAVTCSEELGQSQHRARGGLVLTVALCDGFLFALDVPTISILSLRPCCRPGIMNSSVCAQLAG